MSRAAFDQVQVQSALVQTKSHLRYQPILSRHNLHQKLLIRFVFVAEIVQNGGMRCDFVFHLFLVETLQGHLLSEICLINLAPQCLQLLLYSMVDQFEEHVMTHIQYSSQLSFFL